MPTSVALGSHFEQFIKAQLATGRYNNVSEVVREGLRLLEDQEALRQVKLQRLRADIQAGLDSCSGPITSPSRPDYIGFSGPHSLRISECPGPHCVRTAR